jgi:Histidine phosphatase superfamily (branch 1)
VAFLRHGQTAPSIGTDFERLLTEEGRSQARQAGLVFGRSLKPYFSTALISPAPRTTETAEIFLSSANANTTLQPIDILYDGTMQQKGPELFRKIGYAPLSSYLENDDDDIRIPSQLVLGSYANSCVESIMEQVSASTSEDVSPSNQPSYTLLVVGHAVYLPAAALAVCNLLNCQDSHNIILQTNTREAEGYLIDCQEKSVNYLSRDE